MGAPVSASLSQDGNLGREHGKWYNWWLHLSFEELAIAFFCLYASRLLLTPLWTIPHIPYVSPIYKQGLHWAASPTRKAAILIHITLGIVMLAAGVHQVRMTIPIGDKRNRHRWVGRVYVLSGLGVIASLQPLASTMGQGSLGSPNIALVAMAETTSVLWLACISMALWQIRKGRKESHARLMRSSLWMALTPLTQRLVHAVLVPAALVIQTLRGLQEWPGSGERIWSSDGYGRCSQAILAGSAWSGLVINIAFAVRTQYFANRGTRRESTTGGRYEAVVSQDYEAQELQEYDPHASELDQLDTDDIRQMHAGIL